MKTPLCPYCGLTPAGSTATANVDGLPVAGEEWSVFNTKVEVVFICPRRHEWTCPNDDIEYPLPPAVAIL